MGKKKAFIDKKNARTFSLISRADDDSDDDGGALVPADAAGVFSERGRDGPAPSARDFFSARLEAERPTVSLDDSKRREIVDLGLPDDGYDYLKHLRAPGGSRVGLPAGAAPGASSKAAGAAAATIPEEESGSDEEEVAAGPSVFIAAPVIHQPAADVGVVDARCLAAAAPAAAQSGDAAPLPRQRVPTKGAAAVRLEKMTKQARVGGIPCRIPLYQHTSCAASSVQASA